MFTAILSAIPLWVVPLLFGLILLGTRATRDRTVSPWLVYTLPLLGLLSLFRALGLTEADIALRALLLSYLAGTGLGYRMQPRWIVARSTGRVHLRGEWVTMTTILGLFTLNFATGMTQGMAPALADGVGFAVGFGTLAGLMSGSLLGRALRVAHWPVTTD
jgi:hypothetical protein